MSAGCDRIYCFGALTLATRYAAACGASAIVDDGPGKSDEIGISGTDDRLRLIVAGNEANGDVAADS